MSISWEWQVDFRYLSRRHPGFPFWDCVSAGGRQEEEVNYFPRILALRPELSHGLGTACLSFEIDQDLFSRMLGEGLCNLK